MTVINQYQAAKRAGVKRQTINEKSKQTPRPAYFVKMGDGPPWIDTSHPLWIAYMKTRKARKGILENEEKFNKLLAAVVDAIQETYNPEEEEMNELLSLIESKFEGET